MDGLLREAIEVLRRSPQAKLVWGEDGLKLEHSLFIEVGPGHPVVQLTITRIDLISRAQEVLVSPRGREQLIAFLKKKAAEQPPIIRGRYTALMEDGDDGTAPSSTTGPDEDPEGPARP